MTLERRERVALGGNGRDGEEGDLEELMGYEWEKKR